jgi:hypothetical protein
VTLKEALEMVSAFKPRMCHRLRVSLVADSPFSVNYHRGSRRLAPPWAARAAGREMIATAHEKLLARWRPARE